MRRVVAPCGPVAARSIDEGKLKEMLTFFLAQLQAQCARILDESARADFDVELRRLDPGAALRVAALAPRMRDFFAHKARGDKWVPWHTVLCDHERYIFQRIYSHAHLTDRAKYVWGYVFSGSRHIPLFEAVFQPYLNGAATGDPGAVAAAAAVIDDVAASFRRGGRLHRALLAYRSAGNQIHTTSYAARPPKGASGDEYVFFILQQTAKYAKLGHRVYDVLQEPGVTMDRIVSALTSADRVGPTLSKMFLITTDLRYPELRLCADNCQVGDGANIAFQALFDRAPPRLPVDRQAWLKTLHSYVVEHADQIEPGLLPMIAWSARRARTHFRGVLPPSAFNERLAVTDLQVNLCEWRKFESCSPRHSESPAGTPPQGSPSLGLPSPSVSPLLV